MEHETSLDRKFVQVVLPDLLAEAGEIERVAEHAGEDPKKFTEHFLTKARVSSLVELSPRMWAELKNSDSFGVHFGAWDEVAKRAAAHTGGRDWKSLRRTMENNTPVPAPVVARLSGELHLVSGNTRLMVAKALGKIPHVFLVDLTK